MFLDDADGYIEENDGIKYLVFTLAGKNKEALKNYTKHWEETKKQIEVINDVNQLNTEKTSWKLGPNQTMTCPWVKHSIFLTW